MSRTIDLSGTPFDEPCAQVGRDPDASVRSRQEALAYRAALTAALGLPPEGYAFEVVDNLHDFGTYSTVRLRCPTDGAHYDEAYEALAENGLAHWHEAMMPAPYDYAPDSTWTAICQHSPSREAIERALITSRPAADGTFALDLFARIHANLRAGYPDHAARADLRIASIHEQSGATVH
ncbi:MAG: hypothetical protein B7X90_17390 [Novosphingobium sp. 17-62-19]|uniref:hypothetical protein n=1 Tax=Novosphingobium sp. 17-62-19 TaxID=1970406 RepID=UPI000BD3FE3E|nr:hypothetical protein [Novosphingobium sp. 17-62-19]OYX95387.1 MAG: hypothetical protein B7Y74_04405 [Novosphingobium sp. 35-62-5]OZA16709.1 MAG: hypothetical protein B7X90_17390 [Novosphingobium sp. 17-62-19]